MKPYYFAAKTGEGCGHHHRKVSTALKCVKRMNDWNQAWFGRRSFAVYKWDGPISPRRPAKKVLEEAI